MEVQKQKRSGKKKEDKLSGIYTRCLLTKTITLEMKYVGKQPVNPNATSIPLTPPNGEPYILFRQVCDDTAK